MARAGDGTYYVCSTLFFTGVIGFTPLQMSVALTVGWVVALFLNVPIGRLADRIGPKRVVVASFITAAFAVGSYTVVSNYVVLFFVAAIYSVSQHGGSAAQQALLVQVADRTDLVRSRAYIQSSYNLGLAIGAGIGGIILLFNSDAAFVIGFVLNAIAFLIGAAITTRVKSHNLPPLPTKHQAGQGPLQAGVLRNRLYVLFTLLNAILLLHNPLIDIALPLWITDRTAAPVWSLSVLFLLNTAIVVAFQVRVSSGVRDARSARRYIVAGACLLAASCLVFSLSAVAGGAWVGVLVLVIAAALQVGGEMMHSAGSWELSFSLAPDGRHGEYQAFFGNSFTASEIAGPLALTGLIVYLGIPGWWILGALFIVAALLLLLLLRARPTAS